MFDLVSTDLNIYALTSTDNYNLNVQAYCGRHGKVDGVRLGICLGDLFSVTWMEDLEANDPCKESLDQQAKTVIDATKDQYATVQQHGDQSFVNQPVGNFLGGCNQELSLFEKFKHLSLLGTAGR